MFLSEISEWRLNYHVIVFVMLWHYCIKIFLFLMSCGKIKQKPLRGGEWHLLISGSEVKSLKINLDVLISRTHMYMIYGRYCEIWRRNICWKDTLNHSLFNKMHASTDIKSGKAQLLIRFWLIHNNSITSNIHTFETLHFFQ